MKLYFDTCEPKAYVLQDHNLGLDGKVRVRHSLTAWIDGGGA